MNSFGAFGMMIATSLPIGCHWHRGFNRLQSCGFLVHQKLCLSSISVFRHLAWNENHSLLASCWGLAKWIVQMVGMFYIAALGWANGLNFYSGRNFVWDHPLHWLRHPYKRAYIKISKSVLLVFAIINFRVCLAGLYVWWKCVGIASVTSIQCSAELLLGTPCEEW